MDISEALYDEVVGYMGYMTDEEIAQYENKSDGWIFQKALNNPCVTQAICPYCRHVNAENSDLNIYARRKWFEEEHPFCFSCGKRVVAA